MTCRHRHCTITPTGSWVCVRCGADIGPRPLAGEWICEQHPDKPWPHGDCPGPGMPIRRSQRTTRECAVRARADDRNRGRKRAQTGGHGRTSLDRPERGRANPSPAGRPSGDARALRGRRAADGRRHAIGLLDIGASCRRRQWSSSTSSRRPSSPARRPDRLAVCMGYRSSRREMRMTKRGLGSRQQTACDAGAQSAADDVDPEPQQCRRATSRGGRRAAVVRPDHAVG
jgi:hypothetical protein